MDIVISSEGAQGFIDNAKAFLELDATDDDGFTEALDRATAAMYVFEDLLREAGEITDPLTDLAAKARIHNPYYVAILPKAGASPKRSGKKG